VFRPDVLRDAEKKVRIIRDNLKIAQSRHKSYAELGEESWFLK
jgi:hypothetical protein